MWGLVIQVQAKTRLYRTCTPPTPPTRPHAPPGTDSSAFKSNIFIQWRQDFYTRLCTHVQRANQDIGCTCGHCGEPMIVAFAGKRQLQELFLVDVPKRLVPPLEVGRLDAKPPVCERFVLVLWRMMLLWRGCSALSVFRCPKVFVACPKLVHALFCFWCAHCSICSEKHHLSCIEMAPHAL